MVKGTLSISILVDERPRVIRTMFVTGNSFAEIEDEAMEKVRKFEERNKGLVVCCVSLKVILWA